MNQQKKIPCSVPILTLNSEAYLERCLRSLSSFEDVYIVDGNSTDKTQEIAKRYGVKIYKQADSDEPNLRIENFSEVRRRAHSFAGAPWIFEIDSDEYVSEAVVEEVRKVVEESRDKNVAYALPNRLIFGDRIAEYGFCYPNYRVRLYRTTGGVGYSKNKVVHELVTVPEGVIIKNLKSPVYSRAAETYTLATEKEKGYLKIVRNKYFSPEVKKKKGQRTMIVKSAVGNFLQGFRIILQSFYIYLRHGYGKSVPFFFVVSQARYHFVLSFYRVGQLLNRLV